MADGHLVIQARSLTKSYRRHRGIVDLDLQVEAGQVLGLVGANGAGKTTFMRTLLDFVRPTSGSLRVLGMDSVRDCVQVRARCSYLPGELVLPPRLTGHQVVRRYAFTRSGQDLARAPAIAERLGLDLSRRVQDLSKGNKQKVGLVLAFLPQADLLVLDEPTSGLDPLLQREFATMVREVAAGGATVLLSSHVMSEVEDITSTVALLREGRLAAFDTMAAIRDRARRRGRARPADPGQTATLAQALQAVPGVSQVRVHADTVAFALEGPADPVLKCLAGFTISALDLSHADLEDAFFAAEPAAPAEGVRR